jgi:GNAT superfamily N-acetyltransferase/ubiquinone/menaquinone biosynthesis C-methylase UbiE
MIASTRSRDDITVDGKGFTIRHARVEDLPHAQAVIRRVLMEDIKAPYTPMWHYDVDQPQVVYLENPRHALFVAIDDATGEVIGTTGVQNVPPKSPPHPTFLTDRYRPGTTAQLFRVYIAREHRRRGIASALVEAARRFVAGEGSYSVLYLHTDASVEGAEAFWRSVAVPVYDGRADLGGSDAVHFELPLHAPLPRFRDPGATLPIDWQTWLRRWDRQQGMYIPLREQRFTAMLDFLGSVVGDEFTAIDLMCGPGEIAKRITDRFPKARVIAIDLDPVLIAIGRGAIGDADGRIVWQEADFQEPSWRDSLGVEHVDAVLSTTAIHWLSAGGIVDLYRLLAGVIRPGGVFLNGDQMEFEPAKAVMRGISQARLGQHREHAARRGVERWEEWWLALRQEPQLEALFRLRDERFAWRSAEREKAIGSTRIDSTEAPARHTHFAVHKAGLLDAGFSEVDTIWQHLANRVLAAIR